MTEYLYGKMKTLDEILGTDPLNQLTKRELELVAEGTCHDLDACLYHNCETCKVFKYCDNVGFDMAQWARNKLKDK